MSTARHASTDEIERARVEGRLADVIACLRGRAAHGIDGSVDERSVVDALDVAARAADDAIANGMRDEARWLLGFVLMAQEALAGWYAHEREGATLRADAHATRSRLAAFERR